MKAPSLPAGRVSLSVGAFEDDFVPAVAFFHKDIDLFRAGRVDFAAHVVAVDGQFAVAAIHEDKEFHRLGAAIVEDGFQRGADRAPVNSTSSTRMTFLLSRGVVMLDSPMVGRACIVVQSSRYRLMSSVPKGSFRPSLSSSTLPRRTARSTPRRWMPSSTVCSQSP